MDFSSRSSLAGLPPDLAALGERLLLLLALRERLLLLLALRDRLFLGLRERLLLSLLLDLHMAF